MIQGLLAAVAVILRFAFLFGIYYLINGLLLLSGRRLPLRGMGDMSKEDWEKWAAGEGRVCLYWAVILLLASVQRHERHPDAAHLFLGFHRHGSGNGGRVPL